MREIYLKSMQTIKKLDIKTEKAYKLIFNQYQILSSESLKYICQTRRFNEIIERAKELK